MLGYLCVQIVQKCTIIINRCFLGTPIRFLGINYRITKTRVGVLVAFRFASIVNLRVNNPPERFIMKKGSL